MIVYSIWYSIMISGVDQKRGGTDHTPDLATKIILSLLRFVDSKFPEVSPWVCPCQSGFHKLMRCPRILSL